MREGLSVYDDYCGECAIYGDDYFINGKGKLKASVRNAHSMMMTMNGKIERKADE